MDKLKPLESSFSGILKTYSPYLKEVRKRFTYTIVIFVVATITGFIFNEQIVKFLISGLSLEGINIVFTSPFQFINLAISCGLATGIVVVLPLFIIQVLSFLKPALKQSEYKLIITYLPLVMLLFVVGFIFGAVIMKWQIEIFLARSIALGIGNILDISGLLSTVLLTSALLGLGFQFPIVLLILMKLNIITRKKLAKKRKWVYLGSFVFTLFLPPDSILADIILSLPLILLFEMTLLLNWKQSRQKK